MRTRCANVVRRRYTVTCSTNKGKCAKYTSCLTGIRFEGCSNRYYDCKSKRSDGIKPVYYCKSNEVYVKEYKTCLRKPIKDGKDSPLYMKYFCYNSKIYDD